MNNKEKKLTINDDYILTYNHHQTNSDICVIFLSGFLSNKDGKKTTFLEEQAKKLDVNYIRFDYRAHGSSTGKFKDFTISNAIEDTKNIINNLAGNKQLILIGSSMGAWIMIKTALLFKNQVKSLIGIASAPDFTEELIWNNLSDDEKRQILIDGKYRRITKQEDDKSEIGNFEEQEITINLIEDGRKNLVLHSDINLNIPIYLIHGTNDNEVPYCFSMNLAQKITSSDVTVNLVKSADHRFSSEKNLKYLSSILNQAVENL